MGRGGYPGFGYYGFGAGYGYDAAYLTGYGGGWGYPAYGGYGGQGQGKLIYLNFCMVFKI